MQAEQPILDDRLIVVVIVWAAVGDHPGVAHDDDRFVTAERVGGGLESGRRFLIAKEPFGPVRTLDDVDALACDDGEARRLLATGLRKPKAVMD